MNIQIHILRASGRLKLYEKELKRTIKKCITISKRYLPLKDIDIVVLDNPKSAINHLGVGGYTADGHTLYINLNPEYQNFNKTINTHLFRTLVHELHHVMRCRTVGYGETLLEALISEGLADHFEIELTTEGPQAWDKVLSEKQINIFLKKAQKEFHNKNYSHTDWFFGSEKRRIPEWTGYSLGFYLVKKYLEKHQEKKASSLYNVEAKVFIKKV